MVFFAYKTAEWKDVYLSFCSGFVASALTGFFVDLANAATNNNKRQNLGSSYLDHMPQGFLFVIKGFNDMSEETNDEKANTLIDLFRNLVDKVQSKASVARISSVAMRKRRLSLKG